MAIDNVSVIRNHLMSCFGRDHNPITFLKERTVICFEPDEPTEFMFEMLTVNSLSHQGDVLFFGTPGGRFIDGVEWNRSTHLAHAKYKIPLNVRVPGSVRIAD